MLKTMYITNKPDVAQIVEQSTVDYVMIDLEFKGKVERQTGRNTVISHHDVTDIDKVKSVLDTSKMLVRINAMDSDTKSMVDEVIKRGADIVMLPMYKTVDDVERFIDYVGGRAETMLLLETSQAVNCLDDTLRLKDGIDAIHIGLNDLHISYKMKFMFEPLANGMIDDICNKIKATGIHYGFGGIARLDKGLLPGRYVLADHYRLGSSMTIISRSFTDYASFDKSGAKESFISGMKEVRDYEKYLSSAPEEFFAENHEKIKELVSNIVNK